VQGCNVGNQGMLVTFQRWKTIGMYSVNRLIIDSNSHSLEKGVPLTRVRDVKLCVF